MIIPLHFVIGRSQDWLIAETQYFSRPLTADRCSSQWALTNDRSDECATKERGLAGKRDAPRDVSLTAVRGFVERFFAVCLCGISHPRKKHRGRRREASSCCRRVNGIGPVLRPGAGATVGPSLSRPLSLVRSLLFAFTMPLCSWCWLVERPDFLTHWGRHPFTGGTGLPLYARLSRPRAQPDLSNILPFPRLIQLRLLAGSPVTRENQIATRPRTLHGRSINLTRSPRALIALHFRPRYAGHASVRWTCLAICLITTELTSGS